MAARDENDSNSTIEIKLDFIIKHMASMQERSNDFVKEILGGDLYESLKILQITKERLQFLEDEQRRRNIVFYGIQDCNGELYQELGEKVMYVVNKVMGIKMHWCEMDHFYRIGKYTQGKARPVMIKLGTQWRKADILYHSHRLKGSHIYVLEDFSKEIEKERKELMPILRELRKTGKHVVLKRNKLFVDGKEWKRETETTQPVKESNSAQIEIKEEIKEEYKSEEVIENQEFNSKQMVTVNNLNELNVAVDSIVEDLPNSKPDRKVFVKQKPFSSKKKLSKKKRLKNKNQ